MTTPHLSHSWPRAIAHIDGDAFFASVEQAVKPHLKGKPVVTGQERNIVAAASYEAKRFGVKRGVTLWDAKKMCPGLVVLPTDYETVSLFSKRMFDIMRRYTPAVEEYSIDEGFIDLTGLRRLHQGNYETIARRLQQDIHRELDLTVTVGLSVSKVLTKVASAQGKHTRPSDGFTRPSGGPAGFVRISTREIEDALRNVPIADVWNIGPNTAALLKNHGMHTALQFANRPQEDIAQLLTKPGLEVWHELNGESVLPIATAEKASYQSISKVKTFTPPSDDQAYVFAQLMKNVENACIKARRYNQAPKKIAMFLKRKDHRAFGLEAKLDRPSAYPNEVGPVFKALFNEVFQPGTHYRATGVVLTNLVEASPVQPTLFENPITLVKTRRLYNAIDELRERFGKHVVHSGVTLSAQKTQHLTSRGDTPVRKLILLKGETKRRRLPLPMLQAKAD